MALYDPDDPFGTRPGPYPKPDPDPPDTFGVRPGPYPSPQPDPQIPFGTKPKPQGGVVPGGRPNSNGTPGFPTFPGAANTPSGSGVPGPAPGQSPSPGPGPTGPITPPSGAGATPQFPYLSSLGVYDPGKFANPTSPKYVFLNLAAQYGVATQQQRDALLAALRTHPSGFFQNAYWDNDRLMIGGALNPAFDGINGFDVIRDFGGANGIVWQPLGGTPGASSPAYTPAGVKPGGLPVSGVAQGSTPPAAAAAAAPYATPAATPSGSAVARPGANGGTPSFSGSPQEQIIQAYQTFLGRTPSQAEILSQLGNGSFQAGDPRIQLSIQNIQHSPEAQAYAASHPATPATPATPAAPAAAPAPNGAVFDDPATAPLEAYIKRRAAELGMPIDDPMRDQLLQVLQGILEWSQTPAYSDSEAAGLRVGMFDQLEQDRQVARQQMLETLAARGIDPSSGIALSALQEVDRHYDELRAQRENQLFTSAIQRGDYKRGQGLAAATGAAEVTAGARTEQEQREATLLNLLGILPALAGDRFNQSLALINGTNPTDAFSMALQAAGLQSQNANAANGSNASYYAGLGQLLGYILGNNQGQGSSAGANSGYGAWGSW